MIDALPGDIFHRGQILNNTYEIEGVIGRGGTGEVYRAKNLISGRVVAIKALNAQFSGQEGYIELMRREEQMRDIRDDAVVRYTECSRSDQGHVFLVMDYIAGPSIADEMLKRRLEPRELMIIAHRVAEGLVAAHGQGIVHRDLSPDNVILRDGSPEKATIIDFGIAKDTGAGARTIVGNDFAGKYEYAAPEQMEGRAEARSDLYALGALLLAAWKGQVPFAGMTPGEMIRRKQDRLDTSGVPEPLKGLIDWLSEPALAQRAPSAQAVVDQVGRALKPQGADRHPRTPPPTRLAPQTAPRRRLVPVLFAGLLAVAGGALWYAGYVDRARVQIAALIADPLPVASPYTLSATAGDGELETPRLNAHAPDEVTELAIRQGFSGLVGADAAPDAVTLAMGVPFAGWADGAAQVFAAAKGLQRWRIEITDEQAEVSGIAPDGAAAVGIGETLKTWASTHGFSLRTDILAGPERLPVATVRQALAPLADCGALAVEEPPSDSYPLGATITVTGDAATAGLEQTIADALSPLVGARKVQVHMTVLNDHLCRVRATLPDVATNALSLWFGQGETGEANLAGVFRTNDNPVVDVLIPANVTDGQLWVMAVDSGGTVFNVLPNINFEENALDRLGVIEGGTRRIRVLFSMAEKTADPKRLAMKVNDADYGKSEIIAFVTKEDLFDTRRPRDESVGSFAEALVAAQAARPGNILAFASRILESRP